MADRPPPPDRRRFRRARAPILVRPVSALARAVPRRVNDVSVGGLRAWSDTSHTPGTRLELELLFPDGTSATVLGEVVWVDPVPFGAPARFDLGIQFVDAMPGDLERIARVLQDGDE